LDKKLTVMISQLVEKFSLNSTATAEQSVPASSFEESLVQFEKLGSKPPEQSVKSESSSGQIGTIGFDLLEAKELENAFRSSYNQLLGHWQLSPSSKHRFAFVNCTSRTGREYLFGVLGSKRDQLANLILVVSDVSALKEFGISASDRPLVTTMPLQASGVEFCLNALAERRKSPQGKIVAKQPNISAPSDQPVSKLVSEVIKPSLATPLVASSQAATVVQRGFTSASSIDSPTFGLTTFPPVAILSLHRSHVRLSALMLHKARTIEELAADTKTSALVVTNFFGKCRDAKLLIEHAAKSPTQSTEAQPSVVRPVAQPKLSVPDLNAQRSMPSMLGRLRAKFGF
jgi:hypothetical protein